jgi:hypothetical protein
MTEWHSLKVQKMNGNERERPTLDREAVNGVGRKRRQRRTVEFAAKGDYEPLTGRFSAQVKATGEVGIAAAKLLVLVVVIAVVVIKWLLR